MLAPKYSASLFPNGLRILAFVSMLFLLCSFFLFNVISAVRKKWVGLLITDNVLFDLKCDIQIRDGKK